MKIFNTKTRFVLYSLLFGLIIACFSQSCGSTKGSPMLSPGSVYTKPINGSINYYSKMDYKILPMKLPELKKEPAAVTEMPEAKRFNDKSDSILNNQSLVLRNQSKSLENEGKILDLLKAKDKENIALKARNEKLSAKSELTKEVQNNSVIQETVWQVGKYLLMAIFLGHVITILLIARQKQKASTQSA